MRMSVLTEGQDGMEDQSLGLVEEETVTDACKALHCPGLSVQCYQPLSVEREGGENIPDTQA